MNNQDTVAQGIQMTPEAVNVISNFIAEKNMQGHALRVYITGVGCSGYQYGMTLDKEIQETDLTFNFNDVSVVVDEMTFDYMEGSIIDYVDTPMGTGFKISNPNFVPACNCGDQSSQSGCEGCG
jgi:iron-sulfur cluster assembly accessory protein